MLNALRNGWQALPRKAAAIFSAVVFMAIVWTAGLAPPIALIPVILGAGLSFVLLLLIAHAISDRREDPEARYRSLDLSALQAVWQLDMRYAVAWENPDGVLQLLEQKRHIGDLRCSNA